VANTLDNLLDGGFIDKVIQPQLIGVLKLEFVVVGKEPDQCKWRRYPLCCVGILYELARPS